jgi:hypothetical protein
VFWAFKDLPIAIVSFDRVFYQESGKRAMLIGLGLVSVACYYVFWKFV